VVVAARKDGREAQVPAPTLEGLWKRIVDVVPRGKWIDRCPMGMGVDQRKGRLRAVGWDVEGPRGRVAYRRRGEAEREERTWWLCCEGRGRCGRGKGKRERRDIQ